MPPCFSYSRAFSVGRPGRGARRAQARAESSGLRLDNMSRRPDRSTPIIAAVPGFFLIRGPEVPAVSAGKRFLTPRAHGHSPTPQWRPVRNPPMCTKTTLSGRVVLMCRLMWRKATGGGLCSLIADHSCKVGGGALSVPGDRDRRSRQVCQMNELRLSGKPCPICGIALVRVPTDGCSLVFRCFNCKTEIVKPMPREAERRRMPDRRVARFRA